MTDIRKGDLVKATRKDDPEQYVVSRVASTSRYAIGFTPDLSLTPDKWDIEVLDRPAPPVDEELINGAKRAWLSTTTIGRADWKAVINYLRENDTYRKESNK